jgi:hypothetical protein
MAPAVRRKVILPYRVERAWNSKRFRPNYHGQQELTALDGVFHLLDGKGVLRGHRGPLIKAIEASEDGRGETDYFAFRCFKNGNLHLTMKPLDLVKELNGLAAGEYVLGEDMAERSLPMDGPLAPERIVPGPVCPERTGLPRALAQAAPAKSVHSTA